MFGGKFIYQVNTLPINKFESNLNFRNLESSTSLQLTNESSYVFPSRYLPLRIEQHKI